MTLWLTGFDPYNSFYKPPIPRYREMQSSSIYFVPPVTLPIPLIPHLLCPRLVGGAPAVIWILGLPGVQGRPTGSEEVIPVLTLSRVRGVIVVPVLHDLTGLWGWVTRRDWLVEGYLG